MFVSFQGRSFRYLLPLLFATVFFQMVSDVTAGKIALIGGVPIAASILYFPLTFVFSDILTEVYGYVCARRVLWMMMACSVGAGAIYKGVAALPSPAFFEGAAAYERVLGIMPRILLAGWIAVFAGESANNYVLAKMKVLTRGRYLWTRTVGSTLIGQGVNTLLFYAIGLSGVLPSLVMGRAIVAGWVFKVAIEVLCTPWVYWVVAKLKKAERQDAFDQKTAFNPLLW